MKILWILLGLGLAVIIGMGLVFALAGRANSQSMKAHDTARTAIKTAMDAQSEAWNRGDIDAFMEPYERSERLRFASGNSVTYGWDETLARYKSRYTDRATMGQLAFTDVEISILDPKLYGHAIVFGRWTLTRDNDAPTGLFTLHWEHRPVKTGEMESENRWVIVSDHTSSE